MLAPITPFNPGRIYAIAQLATIALYAKALTCGNLYKFNTSH
tara:strand:+ start:1229 stop:1354 length:126 start_codon:yes stop_codon:yes gene_type:complete